MVEREVKEAQAEEERRTEEHVKLLERRVKRLEDERDSWLHEDPGLAFRTRSKRERLEEKTRSCMVPREHRLRTARRPRKGTGAGSSSPATPLQHHYVFPPDEDAASTPPQFAVFCCGDDAPSQSHDSRGAAAPGAPRKPPRKSVASFGFRSPLQSSHIIAASSSRSPTTAAARLGLQEARHAVADVDGCADNDAKLATSWGALPR